MWTLVLTWSALAVYAVIVLSTVLVVLLDNRQPYKTIAWVVVLVLLPFVGLVFFYFFGQNIRKERYINRRNFRLLTEKMLAEHPDAHRDDFPPKYVPLISLFERKHLSVATPGNEVCLLRSGREFMQALLQDIGSAVHHIHVETYIIEDDTAGRLLRDALTDAVRRGVTVRFIYDDVGCWNVPNDFFASFVRAGIEVQPFLPVRFPSLTHKVNYRNHRKVIVVDGRVGFIGGMNFANRYMERAGIGWRDLHMRLTGGAVATLQRNFLSDWYFVTDTLVTSARCFPVIDVGPGRGALIQIVDSNPVSRYPEIMYGLTWAFQHARKYLYIQTPYFMPTEPVLQAMQTAAMSGVDVRLMVPLKPDGFWLRWANDSYFAEVLRAGIRIFTFAPGFLHSKCVVMDDDYCSIGSSNMDFRSFENNFEANAFIYDRATALQVKEIFLSDEHHCREVTLSQWSHRSYGRRLLESCTRILSPLL